MPPPIPAGWKEILNPETQQPYYKALQAFVAAERRQYAVYPPEGEVFTALKLTPFKAARVLILGQDPYHRPGQAHGLAFSVRPGVPIPPSLMNIFREGHADLGLPIPTTGDLTPWARQGVLLLNAILTVRAGQANSHKNQGWERFTDAAIRALGASRDPKFSSCGATPRARRRTSSTRAVTPSWRPLIPRRSRLAAASSAAGPSPGSTPPSAPLARMRSIGNCSMNECTHY